MNFSTRVLDADRIATLEAVLDREVSHGGGVFNRSLWD